MISRQSFRAPFHIGKAYSDGRAVTLQVVNPTAGIFAGDHLQCAVRVCEGAQLRLVQPSAARVHAMAPEREARLTQHFSVASGARLGFIPSLLAPHKDSRLTQQTAIEVESGGELFYLEAFAPGRVAHDESFQFNRLDFELDLTHAGRRVARERYQLTPCSAAVRALRRIFPSPCWASVYVISPRLEKSGAPERIRQLHRNDAWVGVSQISPAVWAIKIIARGSRQHHQLIAELQIILDEELQFGLDFRSAPERCASAWREFQTG